MEDLLNKKNNFIFIFRGVLTIDADLDSFENRIVDIWCKSYTKQNIVRYMPYSPNCVDVLVS